MLSAKNIVCEIDPDGVNEIVYEGRGNSFVALRAVRWSSDKEFKSDLRKWYINKEGEEIPGKGISFPDDQAVSELTRVLLEQNFVRPQDIYNHILNNVNWYSDALVQAAQESIDREKKSIEENYYDPNEILGGEI